MKRKTGEETKSRLTTNDVIRVSNYNRQANERAYSEMIQIEIKS